MELQEEALKLEKQGVELAHVQAMEQLASLKRQQEIAEAQTSRGFDIAQYGGLILAGLVGIYLLTGRRR